MSTTWSPGRRKARLALETPYEGVPDHLMVPLWGWADAFLSNNSDLVRSLGIEFRITLPAPDTYGGLGEAVRRLSERCLTDRDFFLDVVEYLLEVKCWNKRYNADWQMANALEHTLQLANSAYKVREDQGGLEMRTTPEVQAQVQEVVNTATGSAGEHLANAWNEAYSRTPDAVKSYSESVKAVESALAQHVSPQNPKQTLGTMIRDVAAKPSKWKFAIADGNVGGVDTVVHMMRMLWDGQTSRHGGVSPTRPETDEEARAAVHLAATLVQFGVSGAFAVV